MNYIVLITQGSINQVGHDRYSYYEHLAVSASSREEAAKIAIERFGITDPENYTIQVA